MKFDLSLDLNLVLMETPIWDDRNKKMLLTDLFTGDIHEFEPSTKKDTLYQTNSLIGSAIPCDDSNKILCAIDRGICLVDKTDGSIKVIADPNQANENNRYNDARVDAAGRVFVSTVSKLYGSADYEPTMLGDFYMVDTDGSVKTIAAGINQYNAIVWNQDSTKMFVVDTYNNQLLCFDYDLAKGPISSGRVALDLQKIGMPDGMCIDSEDNLYICHWTGKISVWDKDLKQIELIDFPVEQVCCCGFGGEDLKDLYVATARFGYTDEQMAHRNGAGSLFVGRCNKKGAMDHFYRVK
ncbi:MAG: SMP-30/gluconolactonase/LRE family protein [Christensenellaceae bacterium]